MAQHKLTIIGIALTAGLLSACSSDNTLLGSALTTSSVDPATPAKPSSTAKIDPACVQLATHIDALRKEGVVERVEQASTGSGKTVQVKRESLAKMAELQKANADFQSKCSTVPMAAPQSASAAAPAQTAQAAKPAAGTKTAAKTASATKTAAAKTADAKPADAPAPAAPAAEAAASTTPPQGQP
jgi:hypothetical protein